MTDLSEQDAPVLSSVPSELIRLLAEHEEQAKLLLRNIKKQLPQLEQMLVNLEDHWGVEDCFYRFYHQSFKVYGIQSITSEICDCLQGLLPGHPMNRQFLDIVRLGTGQEFDLSHNPDWARHTRPMLEGFFHAHFFLKMAVKYGKELNEAPTHLPSGWATVLYLFDLR